jgi:hypothetical protein
VSRGFTLVVKSYAGFMQFSKFAPSKDVALAIWYLTSFLFCQEPTWWVLQN